MGTGIPKPIPTVDGGFGLCQQVNAVARRFFSSFGSKRAVSAGCVKKCDLCVKMWDPFTQKGQRKPLSDE